MIEIHRPRGRAASLRWATFFVVAVLATPGRANGVDGSATRIDGTGPFGLEAEGIARAREAEAPRRVAFSVPDRDDDLRITPGFVRVDVGATTPLVAEGAASGAEWSVLDAAVATVDARGVVTGRSAGLARVVAQSAGSADTALVAVLDDRSIVATAFVDGRDRVEVRPGDYVDVQLVLDMARASPDGALGAALFEVSYPGDILAVDSIAQGGRGAADAHEVAPGRIRFAFAGTAPQGAAEVTLATVRFRVADDAAPESRFRLDVTQPGVVMDTDLSALPDPISAGARLLVVR